MRALAAQAVKTFLVPSPLLGAVVLATSLPSTLTAMAPPAAELTAEIPPVSVTGVRQEANPAVAAAHRAVFQIWTIAQDGIQRQLILTNKRVGAVVLAPVLVKRENFRDGYDKTARFSVKMWIV